MHPKPSKTHKVIYALIRAGSNQPVYRAFDFSSVKLMLRALSARSPMNHYFIGWGLDVDGPFERICMDCGQVQLPNWKARCVVCSAVGEVAARPCQEARS